MKTVVFVDELLLVNFAAAAALLLGAGLLCGAAAPGCSCARAARRLRSAPFVLLAPWLAPLAIPI